MGLPIRRRRYQRQRQMYALHSGNKSDTTNELSLGAPQFLLQPLHHSLPRRWPRSLRPDQGANRPLRLLLVRPSPTIIQPKANNLYSCFPIVPKIACQHLGLAIESHTRPLTLLGGLTSFGGAGNNYSMHVSLMHPIFSNQRP